MPAVPAYLLETVEQIMAKPRTPTVTTKDFFQIKPASEELYLWCKENLKAAPFAFNIHYQIIGHGIPIHRDVGYQGGRAKTLAINYILSPGGENIRTTIYDDNKNLIESSVIEPFRWHSIKVDMLHCVLGLTPGVFRVALSLAPI